jgi:hypothetical protein
VSRRIALLLIVIGAVATAGGCSTPKTASGSFDQGKQQVVRLVLDAARALPATSRYQPPTEVGSQLCKKTIAGYTIGSTGAHRAQVPLIVYPPKDSSLTEMFGDLTASWRKANDAIDRSRENEKRFPQVHAHAAGGNEVIATAFASPFVVKLPFEHYADYVRRARVARVEAISEASWNRARDNQKLADVLVTSQIDLYAVSQCLRGS